MSGYVERIRNAKTRAEAADVYADALATTTQTDTWRPWAEMNRAVLERWTMSGLRWIKARAWKKVSR